MACWSTTTVLAPANEVIDRSSGRQARGVSWPADSVTDRAEDPASPATSSPSGRRMRRQSSSFNNKNRAHMCCNRMCGLVLFGPGGDCCCIGKCTECCMHLGASCSEWCYDTCGHKRDEEVASRLDAHSTEALSGREDDADSPMYWIEYDRRYVVASDRFCEVKHLRGPPIWSLGCLGPADCALGSRVMRSGKHAFTFKINRVGGFGGIMLGVADEDDHKSTFAFSPFAKRMVFGGGYGAHGISIVDKGYRSSRSYVRCHVDMDARTLAFTIDGGPTVDAEVTLPDAVRAWCQLWYKTESVTLVSEDAVAAVVDEPGAARAALADMSGHL